MKGLKWIGVILGIIGAIGLGAVIAATLITSWHFQGTIISGPADVDFYLENNTNLPVQGEWYLGEVETNRVYTQIVWAHNAGVTGVDMNPYPSGDVNCPSCPLIMTVNSIGGTLIPNEWREYTINYWTTPDAIVGQAINFNIDWMEVSDGPPSSMFITE